MHRSVVAKEAILGLIRAQMALVPTCHACRCVGIEWKRASDGGCNWSVTGIEGSGCLDCLSNLLPLVESLRASMDIVEPARKPAKKASATARKQIRANVSIDDQAIHAVYELVDSSFQAARESHTLIGLLAASRGETDKIRQRAVEAIDASRRLMRGLDTSLAAG